MQSKTLKSISEIIPGHSFRKAITPDSSGHTYVFQAKDVIQDEPFLNPTALTKIAYENSGEASFLQKNDVLIVSRGTKFRSTIFLSDSLNVIASASIHIIRTVSPEINPEYVSHFLNSSIGQAALADKITGNYIGALPVRGLGDIKIKLPSLAQQELIVDLHRNVQTQKLIIDHKVKLEQIIINSIFRSLSII